jgi:putative transposase
MRNLTFSVEEFYHVYNRGVEKRLVFLDQQDYYRFISLLYLANGDRPLNMREIRVTTPIHFSGLKRIDQGEKLVDIGAYCLMPNHFHLLLRERVEGGISKFMQRVLTAYSMYFNKKNQRIGSLWEGVYRAQHADSDDYLKYLFSYIHLNPIKLIQSDWKEKGLLNIEKAKKHLKTFEHSSFLDYMEEKRYQNIVLNRKNFPEYFLNKLDFESELLEWLSFSAKA